MPYSPYSRKALNFIIYYTIQYYRMNLVLHVDGMVIPIPFVHLVMHVLHVCINDILSSVT